MLGYGSESGWCKRGKKGHVELGQHRLKVSQNLRPATDQPDGEITLALEAQQLDLRLVLMQSISNTANILLASYYLGIRDQRRLIFK